MAFNLSYQMPNAYVCLSSVKVSRSIQTDVATAGNLLPRVIVRYRLRSRSQPLAKDPGCKGVHMLGKAASCCDFAKHFVGPSAHCGQTLSFGRKCIMQRGGFLLFSHRRLSAPLQALRSSSEHAEGTSLTDHPATLQQNLGCGKSDLFRSPGAAIDLEWVLRRLPAVRTNVKGRVAGLVFPGTSLFSSHQMFSRCLRLPSGTARAYSHSLHSRAFIIPCSLHRVRSGATDAISALLARWFESFVAQESPRYQDGSHPQGVV